MMGGESINRGRNEPSKAFEKSHHLGTWKTTSRKAIREQYMHLKNTCEVRELKSRPGML